MDQKQKETYLRANELYREGKHKDATKLWLSLNNVHIKNEADELPLIWRIIQATRLAQIQILTFLFYICVLSCSLLFGRLSIITLWLTGDLLNFKHYKNIYLKLYEFASSEVTLVNTLAAQGDLDTKLASVQTYFSMKILVIQQLVQLKQASLSESTTLDDTVFNSTFVVALFLMMLGVVVDFYLAKRLFHVLSLWFYKIFDSAELKLRFCIFVSVAIISISTYYIISKTFETKPQPEQVDWLSLIDSRHEENDGEGPSSSSRAGNSDSTTEKKFIEDFKKQLLSEPLSLRERISIQKIFEDYMKMMQKYGVQGRGKQELTPQEIVKKMKSGDLRELEERLRRQKAREDYRKLKNEYGGGSEDLSKEDKEFSEILKKSFSGSDKNTLEEFLKTNKEFEELYGKKNSDKVFKENKENLLKEFASDPQKAREKIREQMKNIANEEIEQRHGILQPLEEDLELRIHSIINFLETGGDIKVFNEMRLKFLQDYKAPAIRLEFALRIDFVIASWNEHQNKYFWQMNRALMMEVVDMILDAAKGANLDTRATHLGWFYLVSGYYQRAREECLRSLDYMEEVGSADLEGAYVNRSNAALAALMMQQGKTAYVEYREIYQKIMSRGAFFSRKREELFTEYIREITASLASDTPCQEGFLCRSLFLEEVNDELALDDLLKYLSLSPTDSLLVKEARLKADLIKTRIERRKMAK